MLDEFYVGLMQESHQFNFQVGGIKGPDISVLLKRLHFVELVLEEGLYSCPLQANVVERSSHLSPIALMLSDDHIEAHLV